MYREDRQISSNRLMEDFRGKAQSIEMNRRAVYFKDV
jgi:hypothetical protein